MSEPFIGETKFISWGYAPKGWAFCDGQTLPISQNQALFSLLGTTYGGDGQTTFALPDLRGRAPLHFGGGFAQGQRGGEEAHALIGAEMPQHFHVVAASGGAGTSAAPDGNYLASGQPSVYAPPAGLQAMNPAAVGQAGDGQPHENMAPFLALNCIIALQGLFPQRD